MPTAPYVKYNQFAEDLHQKVHDLMGTAGSGADTLKVMLSNTPPNVATHAVRADAAEIAAGNGYPAGGLSIANVGSRSGATFSVVATDQRFTAAGGDLGPFRYFIIYNDTSPADSLVNYFDYGSSITLHDTEFVDTDFGATLFQYT